MIADGQAGNRFYRSRTDKKIAGVAGGIAQHLKVDPTLVRLAFVLAAIVPHLGGIAVLGYILLAVLVPERPQSEREEQFVAPAIDTARASEICGALLVGFGLLLLASTFGLFQIFDWNRFWPVALIVLGALLIVKRTRN